MLCGDGRFDDVPIVFGHLFQTAIVQGQQQERFRERDVVRKRKLYRERFGLAFDECRHWCTLLRPRQTRL